MWDHRPGAMVSGATDVGPGGPVHALKTTRTQQITPAAPMLG